MGEIVALSGGKDSTALALKLREDFPDKDFTYVCTPTGNEPDEMFAHWRSLGEMLGKPILPVMNIEAGGLKGVVRQQKMLPNFRARFCTRILKIEPYRAFLALHAPLVSHVGLRADEEGRAGGAYGDIPGVEMRFYLREIGWGLQDVLGYLEARGVAIPRRTDCQWCYHQKVIEWFWLWRFEPDVWAEGEALEHEMGGTFRTPGRDTWPSSMEGLRLAFEEGRRPREIIKNGEDATRNVGQCRVCTL